MTGYGRAVAQIEGKKINVEIKSLNSKTLDLSMRVAPTFREKEMEIRQRIKDSLIRGKVDFSIWIDYDETQGGGLINADMVRSYHQQIASISQQIGIPEPSDWFATLIKLPDVLNRTDFEELSDPVWQATSRAVDESIARLMAFRKQEGAALQLKFEEKLNNIAALLAQIEPYEKERIEKIRHRITDSLSLLPDVQYDQNRLEQELIYYIEKLDISEEKQRLTNHLAYFRRTMAEENAQGKKLGFIAQEMGREINTTGSKSNHAEMQNIVVKMKDELEQIKEQVLNAL